MPILPHPFLTGVRQVVSQLDDTSGVTLVSEPLRAERTKEARAPEEGNGERFKGYAAESFPAGTTVSAEPGKSPMESCAEPLGFARGCEAAGAQPFM